MTDINLVNLLADAQKNGLSEDTVWSSVLGKMIAIQREQFVFSKLAEKISIPRKAGTRTWTARRYNHLPVDLEKGRLAEGIAPVPLKVAGTTVSGTINQYGAYIEITDVTEAIHFDDIFNVYTPELARHAAETIERDLLESIKAEASIRYPGAHTAEGQITGTDVLTFAMVRRGMLTLKNYYREGHPAFGGKPVLVAHTNVIQDLIDDSTLKDFIIVPGYEETPIRNANLQQFKIFGTYFVETSVLEPTLTGASNIPVYSSYLLGKGAYGLLNLAGSGVSFHKVGFEAAVGNPLAQRASVGYKLWTGAKVLDPMAIIRFATASAYADVYPDWNVDPYGKAVPQPHLVQDPALVVKTAPTKVSYAVGTDFNPAGMVVVYRLADGKDIVIDNADLAFAYDFSAAGTGKPVTITWSGTPLLTATQNVTVTGA